MSHCGLTAFTHLPANERRRKRKQEYHNGETHVRHHRGVRPEVSKNSSVSGLTRTVVSHQ